MRRYEFIGKDGSCGYRTGKIYWGATETFKTGYTRFIPLNPLRTIVPYSKIENFLNNWKRV